MAQASEESSLTTMVDLADNLGPHTEQAKLITLCCDGLVVSGRLIGAQEYFDGMRETVLEGTGELMAKYKRAAAEALEKLLPDTERLPERREEWDDSYEPDDRRDAPDHIHLAEATIKYWPSAFQARNPDIFGMCAISLLIPEGNCHVPIGNILHQLFKRTRVLDLADYSI